MEIKKITCKMLRILQPTPYYLIRYTRKPHTVGSTTSRRDV